MTPAEAFEAAVRAAGEALAAELKAASGDREARRLAYERYSDAQVAAGDAYRAATREA